MQSELSRAPGESLAEDNILRELLAAREAERAVALATVVRARGSAPRHAGAKMLVYEDGATSGTIGGGEMESRVIAGALEVLADGQPRILPYTLVDPRRGDPGVCGGEVEIFLEPYLTPKTVLIFGCGHVGRALAALAHTLGYLVVVQDDREGMASPENIPEADRYLPPDPAQALADFQITRNTFVVLLTRNVMVDNEILPHLVGSLAPYVGVMGSKRRWRETRRLLLESGLQEVDLQRFHSPVGLELNAETPLEIAVSIMAEIIMIRRGGDGQRMAESATSAQQQ